MSKNNIRYSRRNLRGLDKELFQELLNKRGIYNILHYSTPNFNYNTSGEIPFNIEQRIWKDGDRLYKLSQEYYNNVEYWWVIAFINQKPTDSHFQVGDIVLIPTPLEDVVRFIGVI